MFFFLKICFVIWFFLENFDDQRVIVEERAIVNVDFLFDSDSEEPDNANNTIGKQNYSFQFYVSINLLLIYFSISKIEISDDDETISDDATTLELMPLEQKESEQGK